MLSKIDWDSYRAIPKMNASTLVAGCKSMLRLKRAIQAGYPEETNAMRVGTGIHALLLEPDEFESRFVVMPDFHLDENNVTANGAKSKSKATSYYRRAVSEFTAQNSSRSVLTREQYDTCLYCIEAIRSRPVMSAMLTDSAVEVTAEGEIDGVQMKGRLDGWGENHIVDVKTTADVSPRAFGRVFANLRYDFKLAIYRELVRQSTGDTLPVYVIAQESGGDCDNCLISVPDIVLDTGLSRVRRVLSQYRRALRNDCWPGVDGGSAVIDLYVPQWAMEDVDDLEFQ